MQRRWLGLGAMVVTGLGSAACGGPTSYATPPPYLVHSAKFLSSQAGSESVLVVAFASYGVKVRRSCVYFHRRSLATGALLASLVVSTLESVDLEKWACEQARPGRLWCVLGDESGLKVLDASSLRTLAEQSRILGGTPELAGEPPFTAMLVDPNTRGFVFESRDGYAWIIDPTTLAPARFDRKVGSIAPPDDGVSPHNIGDEYTFDNETRSPLYHHDPSAPDPTPLHPEHTYLRGRVVARLDDPPRVLVAEDVVDHGPTLWCLFADGTVQWKTTEVSSLSSRLVGVAVHGGMVVIVTYTMLLGVRTQNGSVVWTSPP